MVTPTYAPMSLTSEATESSGKSFATAHTSAAGGETRER